MLPHLHAASLVPLQRYNSKVVGIDKDAKVVTLANGDRIRYTNLLSTLPLDIILRQLGKPVGGTEGSGAVSWKLLSTLTTLGLCVAIKSVT